METASGDRWAVNVKASKPLAETPNAASHRPPVSDERSMSVYEVTLCARFDQKDPWSDRKINWLNVLFTIATYALVMSDVPRAGAKPLMNLRHIGVGVYAFFGSYGYPLLTYIRDPNHLENLTAYNDQHAQMESVPTWSFTYDTTSTEIRTVTRNFNTSGSHILQCMNYEIQCDQLGNYSVQETFDMLDQVIDTVASIPREKLPQILPLSNDPNVFQKTRHAGIVKRRYVDILHEYVSHLFVDSVETLSYRVTHFPQVDSEFDPCATRFDRPYFCDAGPISDFSLTADPADPDSVAIGFVPNAVKDQARASLHEFRNSSENITVDVTIFEGLTHPVTFTGGMIMSAITAFEIVKLTRVRDCFESECHTIRLEDFRFEGGQIMTDIANWDNLVVLLRITAQCYFIIRVLALFAACYYAFPIYKRSWTRTAFLFFSEMPSHVVAYGSPIPIFLYAIALGIDGSIVNTIIQYGDLRLQGSWMANPGGIYRLICILMRRQWLIAAIAMIWVKFQVMSNQLDRHRGVFGVRGHIFGILSAMSMVLGYHDPRLRDCRILEVANENPDIAVLNIGFHARDLSNQRVSGVYSDISSILFCAIVYAMSVVLFRLVVKAITLFFSEGHRDFFFVGMSRKSGRRSSRVSISHDTRVMSAVMRTTLDKFNGTNDSIFFARTKWLPTSSGTMWGLLGLTCSWEYDVLMALAGQDRTKPSLRHTDTLWLMNIVHLSDPLNFVLLKTGFGSAIEFFTYQDVKTKAIFNVVEDLEKVHAIAEERQAKRFVFVGKRSIHDVPFHELVLCR